MTHTPGDQSPPWGSALVLSGGGGVMCVGDRGVQTLSVNNQTRLVIVVQRLAVYSGSDVCVGTVAVSRRRGDVLCSVK